LRNYSFEFDNIADSRLSRNSLSGTEFVVLLSTS
jgi:hypothetical protein